MLSASFVIQADELSVQLEKMCKNVTHCSMEKINASSELNDQMKKMMEATFENTCASMEQNYKSGIAAFPNHYRAALTCVKSMAEAKCKTILEHRNKTRECKEYEALAEKGLN